jgi:hypothetical protein
MILRKYRLFPRTALGCRSLQWRRNAFCEVETEYIDVSFTFEQDQWQCQQREDIHSCLGAINGVPYQTLAIVPSRQLGFTRDRIRSGRLFKRKLTCSERNDTRLTVTKPAAGAAYSTDIFSRLSECDKTHTVLRRRAAWTIHASFRLPLFSCLVTTIASSCFLLNFTTPYQLHNLYGGTT